MRSWTGRIGFDDMLERLELLELRERLEGQGREKRVERLDGQERF